MHVMVLGAGVTGVTTAWSLLQAGFEVSVVDRQPGAALETSFANGGQISVSHPEPWSSPHAPLIALRSIGRSDAPLRLRIGLEPRRWLWLLAFLRECLPARHRRNTDAIAELAVHSAHCLRGLREQTGIEYEQQARGILHLFHSERSLAEAHDHAAMLDTHGIRTRMCSPQECVDLEPALAVSAGHLVGGMYAPDDESGNVHLFTTRLAELAAAQGARFHYGADITALACAGNQMQGVRVRTTQGESTLEADAYVLCLGSYGTTLLAPHGRALPIYPVKGYSVTVPVIDPALAPSISLTDESRRLVLSRLGNHLRIAGTAEISGYDTSLDSTRTTPLLKWVDERFPGAADTRAATSWAGLRPCTPSYVPIIGPSGIDKLWLNAGHSSLGWTLACGSADLVTGLIAGKPSSVPRFPLHRPKH